MDRRRFVGSLVGGVGVVAAGCTSGRSADGESEPATASTIDDYEFTKRRTTSREQTTEVSFDAKDRAVTVDGTLVVGSSSCNEVAVERIEYDAGVLRARVHVTFVGRAGENGTTACTDDVVWKEYELDVRFDDGLPDRVEVTVEDGREETWKVVEKR